MAKFPIEITAKDKTRDVLNKVGDSFAKLTKGSGFERMGKSFDSWAKSGRSISDAWKAIGSLGDKGAEAAGGLGEAAEGASALGIAAGGAALGVGAVVVGLGVATEKAVEFETKMSSAGREVGITSKLLGIGARDLQTFRGAGELAGVPVDQLTSSLQGLGQTLNDARWGRNNQALALWTQMGLKIKTLKDGTIDTKSAVFDLADALQRYPAQTRAFIAAQYGVTGALPFLGQGRAKIQADMDAYTRAHAAMTDEQIDQSNRFQRSLTDLDFKWRSLKNDLATNVVFPWVDPLIKGISSLVGWFDDLINAKLTWDRVLQGVGTYAGFALGGPGAAVAVNGLIDQGRNFAGGGSGPAPAAKPGGAAPASAPSALDQMTQFAGDAFGRFADAIERQESGHHQFNRRGAPLTSGAGALGIMQLLPATAEAAAKRLGIGFDLSRLMSDANYNRTLGREELRFQLAKWGGDTTLTAAAYNAGPAAVERWIKRYGDPRKGQISDADFASHIPGHGPHTYQETRDYIADTVGRSGVERVAVDVHFHNPPKGTVVKTNGTRNVDAKVKIGLAMAAEIAMAGAAAIL